MSLLSIIVSLLFLAGATVLFVIAEVTIPDLAFWLLLLAIFAGVYRDKS